jgi:hypothetical protein
MRPQIVIGGYRSPSGRCSRWAGLLGGVALVAGASAGTYFSAHEGKITLQNGGAVPSPCPTPDTVMFLDTLDSDRIQILELSNSVIGPPSNLAFSNRTNWLLVADSVALKTGAVVSGTGVSYVRFENGRFGTVARIEVGEQPSGIALDPTGEVALVANRRGGTIGILRLEAEAWTLAQAIKVCAPDAGVTDVSIHPDGQEACYVVRDAQQLGRLARDPVTGSWRSVGEMLTLPGFPYRVVYRPAGDRVYVNLASADGGDGMLVCVENRDTEVVLAQVVDLGFREPESVEISPDGRWLVLPMMAGSNLPRDDPAYDPQGRVLIYREGAVPELTQTLVCGAIPEGAAFSEDGLELVVQCHVDRELWLYRRPNEEAAFALAQRLPVDGHPSSLISVSLP